MDGAFAAWDEAIRHAVGNEREYYRTERALERALVGAHAAATQEADQVAGTSDLPAPTIMHLARVYSRSIEAVERDAELSPADRNRLTAACVTSAIDCLRRIETTYLADPERLNEFDSDDAVAALRHSDSFRTWRDTLPRTKE
jgi:hypothetical protein